MDWAMILITILTLTIGQELLKPIEIMNIRCPRKECNSKIIIADAVLYNEHAKVKCPSCKQYFEPFSTLSDLQKKDIFRQKELNQVPLKPSITEKTEVLETKTKVLSGSSTSESAVVGWLIVHDENTYSQTYDLKEGRNLVGKKSASKPCEVMIDTSDPYLSRNHFVINVFKNGGRYEFLIEDYGSTNGTFIQLKHLGNNQCQIKKLAKGEQIFLEDGFLIQAGKTKIFLKTPQTVATKQQATQVVQQKDFTKTIIV